MSQKIRKERITKKEWYDRGGFANSALFRQQSRGGAWRYYVDVERDAEIRQSPRMQGISLILDWQAKAPRGMTLPEWIEAGKPEMEPQHRED